MRYERILVLSLIKFLKAYPTAPFAVVLNDRIDEEILHKDRKIYFISFKNIDYLSELLTEYHK